FEYCYSWSRYSPDHKHLTKTIAPSVLPWAELPNNRVMRLARNAHFVNSAGCVQPYNLGRNGAMILLVAMKIVVVRRGKYRFDSCGGHHFDLHIAAQWALSIFHLQDCSPRLGELSMYKASTHNATSGTYSFKWSWWALLISHIESMRK
ncbi:MAG: hypothetical protein QM520_01270, partial [Gammaproteobacteria bacterium]|nr:hypothetical protein [Gammaproteobacteria bacterium]